MNLKVAALLVSLTTPATAATVNASLDYASSYVFRGVTLNDKPVLQPGLSITDDNLSFGVWGNFNLEENMQAEKREFNEFDLYVNYQVPVTSDLVTLSVGAVEYLYPHSDANADREVNINVGLQVPLNPTISLNYGVGGAVDKNLYAEFSISEHILKYKDVDFSLSGTLGHINPKNDEAEEGITHGLLTANFAYSVVAASINYVIETDDQINNREGQSDVFGTLGVSLDL